MNFSSESLVLCERFAWSTSKSFTLLFCKEWCVRIAHGRSLKWAILSERAKSEWANSQPCSFGKNEFSKVIFCKGLTTFLNKLIVLILYLAFVLKFFFLSLGISGTLAKKRIWRCNSSKTVRGMFFKGHCEVMFWRTWS